MPPKLKCWTKQTNEGGKYTTCAKGGKQLREDAADKEATKFIVPKKKFAFKKKVADAVPGVATKKSQQPAQQAKKIAPKPKRVASQATVVPAAKKSFAFKKKEEGGVIDGDLNAYILSYKGNEVMATRLERQLKERGFPHVKIVYAPDMAVSNMKRNKVVYHTFKEYLLPLLEASKRNNIVLEDDADVYSPYSVYKNVVDKGLPMNRISWWKKETAKGIPSFLAGSTIVGYKKSFIPRLAKSMRSHIAQHIDGWLTKKFKWKEEWDYEPKKGYGGTVSHGSYILNSYRPGQLGNDAPKGYVIPAVEAGFDKGGKSFGKAEGDDKPKQVRKKKAV